MPVHHMCHSLDRELLNYHRLFIFIVMSDEFNWPSFLPRFSQVAATQGFRPCTLCETAAGPLQVWQRAGEGPTIYLSAGIHGDEPAGPLALLQLMEDGFFTDNINWAICPCINPTGLESGCRNSQCGQDLNRDYLKRQTIEISAHTAWLESLAAPDLFLSLHEDSDVENFYFYEINQGSDAPMIAKSILTSVRPWFLPEPGPIIDDHVPREAGWIFHEPEADEPEGWPEAIFLAKRGCPLSYTFETPSRAALSCRVSAQCAAVRAVCREATARNKGDATI